MEVIFNSIQKSFVLISSWILSNTAFYAVHLFIYLFWSDFLKALLEATVKALPQKVLGSAAYQVANMDVLNVSLGLMFAADHFIRTCILEQS